MTSNSPPGPTPSDARLVVRGLRKRFRRTVAVDDVSFELRAGELLGVIGPNGAGKSTTLRMVTGQILPDGGQIEVDGVRIDADPLGARRVTGYVPQQLALYPFLTGREVLMFVAQVRGVGEVDANQVMDELLDRFQLTAAQHRLTREYSDGMARKLSIACALVGSPALLVLDEALVGLDPRATADVKAALTERADLGTAIALVSHQLDVLERICTRVLLIDGGRVTGELKREEIDALVAGGSSLEGWFLEHTDRAES